MESSDQSVRKQHALQGPQRCLPEGETAQPVVGYLEQEDESIGLLDYWYLFVKRRWIILTSILVIVTLTAIATWRTTPIYRATTRIQIDPDQSDILPFKQTEGPGAVYALSQEYLQTQFKVLESRTLARRIIRTLKLEKNPEFVQVSSSSTRIFSKWWKPSGAGAADRNASSEEDQNLKRVVDVFLDRLSTSPIRNSRLVDVSFAGRDPKLAADVANTLVSEYIQMNFETGYRANVAAHDFLAKQLVGLKARVEKSQEELAQFSQQHNIYPLGEKENVIIQKLSELNTALTAAEADRIQKEAVYEEVRAAPTGVLPEIVQDPLIKELETDLATLRQQQAKLSSSFNPGWPALDQITGQVKEAERQLAVQREKAARSVESEYRAAVRREDLLRKALADQKQESNLYNQNSIHYGILQRQADADKQLYEGLLQRMNEARVSSGLHSGNIHAVDAAEVPMKPYRPNPVLNLSLALALGAMLGVGLAFFAEYLDRSIKTPDDINRYLKLPSLGIIPIYIAPSPASDRQLLESRPDFNSKTHSLQRSVELIAHHDMRSVITEAYRNLRTSILLSARNGRPPKYLLITSSEKAEGKTTTAINMAITLAQTGGTVMLLDCDMRNPCIHRALNLKNDEGMSTFLSGNADLPSVIQPSSIRNLSVIASGPIPPNPAELVGSPRMKEGLSFLGSSFDYVVIDTPPVLSVADARILGTVVDGVILVVKSGSTPRNAVLHTRQLLEGINARIIGILLNKVDINSGHYPRYYYYYHGYGTGKQSSARTFWWSSQKSRQ
jgi:succinoglycan biosynthesis transport protein ExoP